MFIELIIMYWSTFFCILFLGKPKRKSSHTRAASDSELDLSPRKNISHRNSVTPLSQRAQETPTITVRDSQKTCKFRIILIFDDFYNFAVLSLSNRFCVRY